MPWVAIGLTVAALAVAVAGGWWAVTEGVDRWYERRWRAMEDIATSVPLRSNMVAGRPRRVGGFCELDFGCSGASISLVARPAPGSDITCDDVKVVIRAWEDDGFDLDRPGADSCDEVWGRVEGHEVRVTIAPGSNFGLEGDVMSIIVRD